MSDETASNDPASNDATPLFDVVRAYMIEKQIEGTFLGDDTTIRFDGQGDNGSWLLFITTFEELDRCAVYSTAKFVVAPDRLPAAYELCSRINVDISVGNFEVNPDNGQIGFRTSVDVEGDRLSVALVNQLVAGNVETFDHYLPSFEAVVNDGAAPADAIAAVDG